MGPMPPSISSRGYLLLPINERITLALRTHYRWSGFILSLFNKAVATDVAINGKQQRIYINTNSLIDEMISPSKDRRAKQQAKKAAIHKQAIELIFSGDNKHHLTSCHISTCFTTLHQPSRVSDSSSNSIPPPPQPPTCSTPSRTPGSASSEAVSNQFTAADWSIFRTALIKTQSSNQEYTKITVDGLYAIWYDKQTSTINIKHKEGEKLKIILDKSGTLVLIELNDQPLLENATIVPEPWQSRLAIGLKKSLKKASSYQIKYAHIYGPRLQQMLFIEVMSGALQESPAYHLEKLVFNISQKMDFKKDPKLYVSFIQNNLAKGEERDLGGPSREYIGTLCSALSQMKDFFTETKTSLMLPCSGKKYDLKTSKLNAEAAQLFQNLGKLFMYCYYSNNTIETCHDSRLAHYDNTYLTGRHFDDVLFKAALSLPAAEVNAPFEKLSLETKIKIAKFLFEVQSPEDRQCSLRRLNLLENIDKLFDNGHEDELNEAAITVVLLFSEVCPKDWIDEDGTSPIIENIKKNPQANLPLLKQYLIDAVLFEGEHAIATHLAPIHAIAQGMKSMAFNSPDGKHRVPLPNDFIWNQFHGIDPVNFSKKIQGASDRQRIINAITLELREPYSLSGKREILKKIDYIKTWIKAPLKKEFEESVKTASPENIGNRLETLMFFLQDEAKRLKMEIERNNDAPQQMKQLNDDLKTTDSLVLEISQLNEKCNLNDAAAQRDAKNRLLSLLGDQSSASHSSDIVLKQRRIAHLFAHLKEQEATDQEIKEFLRGITGSTSIYNGAQLTVYNQRLPKPKITPIIHTCNNSVELSPKSFNTGDFRDDTKDSFIFLVKASIYGQGFDAI